MLAHFLKQRGRFDQVAAELGSQRKLGIFRGHAQPHAQAQVSRRLARFRVAAGIDDLCQLFCGIEAESAHAVFEIGFADGGRRLYRVHEAQHSLRQQGAHQTHLSNRGDIVMRHPCIPQDLDEVRGRVRLHRIEHLARKLLDKEAGGAPRCMRAVEDYRFVRTKVADYSQCVRIDVQLKGPPKRFVETIKRQAALRFGSPLGAAGTAQIGPWGDNANEKSPRAGAKCYFLKTI